MNNNNLDELKDLLNGAKEPKRPLTSEEIELAIQLARNNESANRYNPGLLGVSKYLARTGGLNDVHKSIELALESKDNYWSRHFVLTMLAERLILADDMSYVYKLISQMEKDVVFAESSNDYWPAQRGTMWATIAGLYFRIGDQEKAKVAIEKASHLAAAGQFDQNIQEAHECQIVLRGIVEKLILEYRFATALKIVETSTWSDKDAWIDALNILIKSDIRYRK